MSNKSQKFGPLRRGTSFAAGRRQRAGVSLSPRERGVYEANTADFLTRLVKQHAKQTRQVPVGYRPEDAGKFETVPAYSHAQLAKEYANAADFHRKAAESVRRTGGRKRAVKYHTNMAKALENKQMYHFQRSRLTRTTHNR